MDSYSVEFAKSAEKELSRIDGRYIARIFAAVESLAKEPRPAGCKKLTGSDHTYRIRIGTYRVIYDIQESRLLVVVIKIGHRKDVYQ